MNDSFAKPAGYLRGYDALNMDGMDIHHAFFAASNLADRNAVLVTSSGNAGAWVWETGRAPYWKRTDFEAACLAAALVDGRVDGITILGSR